MIPKIVHYCWLSGDSMPELVINCIKSWKKHLVGYEFILWDTNRFDIESHTWVKETFLQRKYAFAADYIRLYALYHYGGIYLDTDVEVIKPFDDLLHLPYFIGKEKSKFGFEAATLGASKGSQWLKLCLDKFENRQFIIGWGKFDQTVLPEVIQRVVEENYELISISSPSEFLNNEGEFYRFPVAYFSPKDWFTKELSIEADTYSIHHFEGSWKKNISAKERFRLRFFKFIKKARLIRLTNWLFPDL